jgi:DNA mismatch repair protein MutS
MIRAAEMTASNGLAARAAGIPAAFPGGPAVFVCCRNWRGRILHDCLGMGETAMHNRAIREAGPEAGPSGDSSGSGGTAALSPVMRQYQQFKQEHPGYILFFRMGDFFEVFYEDARIAARTLGVALTSRSRGGIDAADAVPMAGVPYHAVDGYLRKMIAAGYKVALCDQVEDSSLSKGLVKRDVVRLMTPGTLTDEPLLDGRADNPLAAVAFGISKTGGYRAAVAWAELSTGAIAALSSDESAVLDELVRMRPAELLVPELPSGQPHDFAERARKVGVSAITARPGWQFTPHHAQQELKRQWQVATAAGFGFADDDPAVHAIAALLTYLHETQKSELAHLRLPRRHRAELHLAIDAATYRSLEIERTTRGQSTEGSLLAAIDRTRSAMGARMLRQWVRYPLCDLEHLSARQAAIAALLEDGTALSNIVAALEDVCDIERVVGRLAVNRATPRDLAALRRSLGAMPELLKCLEDLPGRDAVAPELIRMGPFCREQAEYLKRAVAAEPQPHLREGGVIAPGFDPELDRLRELTGSGQKRLADYQSRLAAESGINSLKVSYNKVFGYYIEVTDVHRHKVPAEWTRRQTVRNAERYVTEELKAFEQETIGARDRAIALEQALYEQVRQALLPHVLTFGELAVSLARTDLLAALASLARERRYCRPTLTQSRVLKIVDGRHPVLEQQLSSAFVSNDVSFEETDALQLITGPNMAGKSTYIRQVALIVLMAQIGSFVPAASAEIGIADRLFARIGASDELHAGQSTFMVEMIESANILNNATDHSLVVLDEIGRGTSTLDGLALAWATAEHLAGSVRCRALFATHYHELTALAGRMAGVRNLNVAVREWEDQVIFLHRIVEGGTDRSYGIHVARLAGVPKSVLERARELLGQLAVQEVGKGQIAGRTAGRARARGQMSLFDDGASEIAQALRDADVEKLTPQRALELLREWKDRLGR